VDVRRHRDVAGATRTSSANSRASMRLNGESFREHNELLSLGWISQASVNVNASLVLMIFVQVKADHRLA
jgi:hypothetical protein